MIFSISFNPVILCLFRGSENKISKKQKLSLLGVHPVFSLIQELAVKTEELLEKLSVTLTGDEIDVLYNLYHQTMILEIDFFNCQPFAQPTVVPVIKGLSSAEDRLMFLSDFDLTCTVHDSSAILAEMALATAPKSDCSQSGSDCSPSESPLVRMSSGELRNMWEEISNKYTKEYEECIESIIPAEKGKHAMN